MVQGIITYKLAGLGYSATVYCRGSSIPEY